MSTTIVHLHAHQAKQCKVAVACMCMVMNDQLVCRNGQQQGTCKRSPDGASEWRRIRSIG